MIKWHRYNGCIKYFLYLEDFVPVRGVGGFGGGAEDFEGGEHFAKAVDVRGEAVGFFGEFEGGFEV